MNYELFLSIRFPHLPNRQNVYCIISMRSLDWAMIRKTLNLLEVNPKLSIPLLLLGATI